MPVQDDVLVTVCMDEDLEDRTENAVLMDGHTLDDITDIFRAAVRDEIAAHQRNGHPVARYDEESKRAYLEYPDGKREYVNG